MIMWKMNYINHPEIAYPVSWNILQLRRYANNFGFPSDTYTRAEWRTRILIGCSVFLFSRYKNSSSYKGEYRQEIKRSFCNAVKSLVWMCIQLNRPTFLNFLLATHILLEPTDSTSLSLWVQKLKILTTFKCLHLNERNKIVCCENL